MKIGIVGCGALGSYYGAMLCRAGEEVHFLLRSDYDIVRQKGVNIHSPAGDFNVRPHCAKSPEEIGVCDLVIIGLKTTANDQFPKLLPPLVGPHTAILTLQNGLGNEEAIEKLFSSKQILGGLCFVCLNRVHPGEIYHIGHGLIVLGEYLRPPEQRTHDIAAMFKRSGVNCQVSDNLERAHWEKLVWNIPFNGLGVAGSAGIEPFTASQKIPFVIRHSSSGPCLTTDKLLNDFRWEKIVRELMMEVIAVAAKLGHVIPASFADKQVERTRPMGAYKASTLVDFERGQPLELDTLFLDPLHQAKKLGVKTPILETLCAVLQELDQKR
jgi:2-dehydropantoate 2-reductase